MSFSSLSPSLAFSLFTFSFPSPPAPALLPPVLPRPLPWPAPSRKDLALLRTAFCPGAGSAIDFPPPAVLPWLLLEASLHAPGPIVVVADSPRAVEDLATDLAALAPSSAPLCLPPLVSSPGAAPRPEASAARLSALLRLLPPADGAE
ncbi:MAG: hypothetical protein IK066_04400, partial [Kiritimatiellae bacterium]|nr:hypothetical protein [Kiritimatiellia bacterium]